ncbi:MAG: OsmC family protein [Verrucomicrobiota bacterium]
MVTITSTYDGGLRCTSTHDPSGVKLITDAPLDNHGKGESFSPTDLVATAVANCMMTVMGIAAERHGIDLKGTIVTIGKEMSSDLPRRIVGLKSVMTIPLPSDHPQRALLENAAKACPVKQSLSPEVDASVEFRWVG